MIKLRVLLIGLAAISVAASAAFFSVSGLSKLFAGASFAVTIMAASLEFSKLVAASFLHNYWKRVNFLLKTYLTLGVLVLIIITSLGIYGFLTSAYQVTADELDMLNKQVAVVELKKNRFEEQLAILNTERSNLNASIGELSKGMSNNVVQYTDANGNLVTTTSSSNRRALEAQLNDAKGRRDYITLQIESIVDSITTMDLSILDMQSNSDVAAEIGPLRYLTEITGKSMSTIVNWFTLLIVFVFDPLAVSLLIAYNAANKIEKGEVTKKEVVDERKLYEDEPMVVKLSDDVDVEPVIDEPENVEETPNEERNTIDFEVIESDTDPSLDDLVKTEGINEIDIDGDGEVDGYDNDGDGLVDELTDAGAEKYTLNTAAPHYTDPDFDWSDRKKWISDSNAVNYWLTHIKNKR